MKKAAPANRDGLRLHAREARNQFGTLMVHADVVIVFAAAGVALIFGTFEAEIGGAKPGLPPRGVVRTTWLAGSGVLFFSFAHMMSIALRK